MFATLLVLSQCVGCGDGNPPVPAGVVVKGKVLRDGKTLDVPNREIGVGRVELQLIPATGPTGDVEIALANADGTFEFLGPGKGVKAGAYKLVVLQQDQGFQSDALEGAFNATRTPIQVTIPADKGVHDLGTIDLQQYLGQAPGAGS